MSDFTQHDLNKLTAQLETLSGAFGTLVKSINRDADQRAKEAERAEKRAARKHETSRRVNKVQQAAYHTKGLSGSHDQIMNTMIQFARASLIGAIGAEIYEAGRELVGHYRQLSEVGEHFGGSMYEMNKAAANARLPLGEFAQLVKNNSAVIASMSLPSFISVTKAVRGTAEAHGMYGMSLDQLNEITGSHLETQRLFMDLDKVSSEQSRASVIQFAEGVSALAIVTNKSRTEIIKETEERMRSATMIGHLMKVESQDRLAASDKIKTSISIMASQFGEAGSYLSTLLAESVSAGAAELTQSSKTIVDAGMGHLVTAMNDVTAGRLSEVEYMSMFKDSVEENAEMLTLMAVAGDENAAKLIQVASQIKKFTQADLDRAKVDAESSKKITALFNNMESVLGRVIGAFKEGLLNTLQPFMNTLDSMLSGDGLGGLEETAKNLGETFGKFISNVLTPENMGHIGEALKTLGGALLALGKLAMSTAEFIAEHAGVFGLVLGTAARVVAFLLIPFKFLAAVVEGMAGIVSSLSTTLGGFGDAILAVVAAMAVYKLALKTQARGGYAESLLQNMETRGKKTDGGQVSGQQGGDTRPKGKVARLKSAIGGVRGGGLMGAAKLLPGLGLVAGGIDAASRLSEGDVKGAVTSAITGVAAGAFGPVGATVAMAIGTGVNAWMDSWDKPTDPKAEGTDPEAKEADEFVKTGETREQLEERRHRELMQALNGQTDVIATTANRTNRTLGNVDRGINTISQQ